MAKRNFMLLYLNTGGGHLAPAKVLKSHIERLYPDATVQLVNGFDKANFVSKLVFEKGYHSMCTVTPGLWRIVYELGQTNTVQKITQKFLNPQTSHYLKEKIIKDDITDIISFHFALTPSAKTAIRKSGKKVNLSVVVTDPFTAPSTWFFTKGIKTYVASQQVKDFAIKKCKFNTDDIEFMPFLINEKFLQKVDHDDVDKLREKYGIPKDKRVVLIAGGGEGLPGTLNIITEFVAKKVDFSVIVVCGRGKKTRKTLEMLKKVHPKMNLFVFGFVTFLDELVKLSDCAIIKGGTSTVLEMLAANTPVILSTFIHGQELGNVRFVYENNAGWFIQKPKDISNKIFKLFSDDEYYSSVKKQTENLNLNTDCTEFVHRIMAQ